MHRSEDGALIVSATDLVGFLACDHLATLELLRAAGEIEKPFRDDPELALLQERGDAHERAYLDRSRAEGRSVREIARPADQSAAALNARQEETLAAMRDGVDVLYQATFFDGRWRGHADFLRRAETPSALGAWSYEIIDTKLSRGVKAGALLQICVYADLLARHQGAWPEQIYVVTGDGREHPHRTADYAAFYRTVKARFERRVLGDGPNPATYPDPVDHCRVCAWFPTCMDRRRADDHLSLVAGMTRTQSARLIAGGVETLTALGELSLDRPVPSMRPRPLARLRDQARLQLLGRRERTLRYELIEPDPEAPDKGLASLPEPSPLDLFFDIEADPWCYDEGLEYLLGVVEVEGGEATYRPIWGHDRAGERAAFEAFIDLVVARLERDPTMHVYHYAPYEPTALKRLAQRHATREEELDRILRGRVLVDLYGAVRNGVRASVESYSLKQIEKLYLPQREGPITAAGFSVVAYEASMRAEDPAERERILAEIAAYNRDDCLSTWMLRGWLEQRRVEALARGWSMDRPEPVEAAASEAQTERQAATRRRIEALTAGVPADAGQRSQEQAARWLLAQLLDWHRRDDKPGWWGYFHRLYDCTIEDLVDDAEALAGLEHVGPVGREAQSLVHRYRFEPQDTKIGIGESAWLDPATGRGSGIVVGFDEIAGTIDLKRGIRNMAPHPRALIPPPPIANNVMRQALGELADWVITHGIDAPGPYRAARDLLLRRRPRLADAPAGGALRGDGESPLEAAIRLGLALGPSALPIQGPPGTGKTYAGAHMIVELVRQHKRIGISAQAHRAISNLLEAICQAGDQAGVPVRAIQKCDDASQAIDHARVTVTGDNDEVAEGLAAGRYDVVAGTAWLFSRPEMAGLLDVLFVDEAGQLSLANVVAMGGAARSIVLLGDPNQLPQVSQGVHPEGAGVSALEHLIGDRATVAEDRGLLLDTTFRLHPDVNAYVSEVFYADRLRTDPSTARTRIAGGDRLGGTGLRLIPIRHQGNASRSGQEAAAVATAVRELLGRAWVGPDGVERRISLRDLIVVAPYNAQVAEIQKHIIGEIGEPARVGTVDKFQGQEGAVAIYSMASSSADDAPRGMDFLFNRNRLNVAVSRARGLAILVANPALVQVHCRTPEQLRMANALCRYLELATSAE